MSVGTILIIILVIILLGGFSGFGDGPFYGTGYCHTLDLGFAWQDLSELRRSARSRVLGPLPTICAV